MAGQWTAEDALEGLRLVWPAYFADPANAPEMPAMAVSIDCYAETFESIREHFARGTLAGLLPQVTIPTVFVLGAASPLPPEHGVASAELMPGAKSETHEGCGHFVWIERPGRVRAAPDSLGAS